jgi:hypothetical protein
VVFEAVTQLNDVAASLLASAAAPESIDMREPLFAAFAPCRLCLGGKLRVDVTSRVALTTRIKHMHCKGEHCPGITTACLCCCSLRKVIYADYNDTYKARAAGNRGTGEWHSTCLLEADPRWQRSCHRPKAYAYCCGTLDGEKYYCVGRTADAEVDGSCTGSHPRSPPLTLQIVGSIWQA